MAHTPTVDDILNMSDSALVQLIQKTRDSKGTLEGFGVRGWEKVLPAKRRQLGDKLRTALNLATAMPLDPNELTTRLTAAAAEMPSPTPRQMSRTQSPDPNAALDFESACYHELVEDGGRAPFALSQIQEVLNDPGSHYELLRPWMRDSRGMSWDDGEAISRELRRWREFRKWQRNHRGIVMGFSEYLEIKRRYYSALKAPEVMDDPELIRTTRRDWEREESSCQLRQGGDFSAYAVAAKRRLSDHGFTQPLRLEEDPKRQDPWTTWVEYLVFEYSKLDSFTRQVKSLRPEFDKALEALLGDKILKEMEGEEDLVPTKADQRWKTEVQGIMALCPTVQPLTLRRQLTDARNRYEEASRGPKKLGATQDRTRSGMAIEEFLLGAAQDYAGGDVAIAEFMRKTHKYRWYQAREQRQLWKVQWVLQQVSKFEATRIVPPNEEKPKTGGGKRGRQGDDALLGPDVKKRKWKKNEQNTSSVLPGSEAAPVTKRRSARIRRIIGATVPPSPRRHTRQARPSKEKLNGLRPRGANKRVRRLE